MHYVHLKLLTGQGPSDGEIAQESCSNLFSLQNCPAKEPFHLQVSECGQGQLLQVVRGDMDSNPLTESSNGFDFYTLQAGLQLPPYFSWNSWSKLPYRWLLPNSTHLPTFHPSCCHQPRPNSSTLLECFLSIFLLRERFLAKVTLHCDWFFTFISHKH